LILPFVLTALLASFLLFWVEPLFARLVLPLLGGSPAVWNTCLMYFQALLLGGYLYAHLTSRYLSARRQSVVHMALLAVALLALPVAIPAGWVPPATGQPIGWLLLLLTVTVGAPFLVLSATAPMLQRWFADTDHPAAQNPYQLYAASNAGSFLGLLAFPIVLEPTLRLGQQSTLWGLGYLLAGGLTVICVATVWRTTAGRQAPRVQAQDESHAVLERPGARDRLRWVALSFVPSSLLLGVTTYLTTDVAAVPFLWVLPLALYLLTFVVVFARSGHTAPRFPVELHALLVTFFILATFWEKQQRQQWAYPLHLGLFAITALVLHGELAASRPSPKHLTEFYLWLALGGALGGVFNALAAPMLFDRVVEYVPMVVLACFLRPSRRLQFSTMIERVQMIAVAAIPALLLALVAVRSAGQRHFLGTSVGFLASLAAGTILLLLRRSSPLFGASLAAVGLAGFFFYRSPESVLHTERSFFGAYRVGRLGDVTFLYHGTTIHGAQFGDSARRLRPVTYYHPSGPAGQLFESLGARLQGKHIGAVGLGAGSLLCYGKPGQEWTFFEIDPVVEKIARDSAYFTYMHDCPVQARVVLGDARLTLDRESDGRFALLILDAFSSDAIPVHLLTREALAIYRRVLEPGGLLLIHISNKHLNLEPVVAALASDADWTALAAEHFVGQQRQDVELDYESDWVLLTERIENAGPLRNESGWRRLVAPPDRRPWSDDYSNVFGAIRWEETE
jgi:hypothetical protein